MNNQFEQTDNTTKTSPEISAETMKGPMAEFMNTLAAQGNSAFGKPAVGTADRTPSLPGLELAQSKNNQGSLSIDPGSGDLYIGTGNGSTRVG
jgi:hypothetical protein